ncbi:MAG: hypothetical protein DI588_18445 [Flavobacterium johnsoniae]|nr:MAG: hypothetical protein DI588_18445 [Flavobacterium johnsoniae]
MKISLFKIVLFLLFISCTQKKDDLDLVLLNSEVVCIENLDFDVQKINEKDYLNNIEYDSLSRNILNYKLTNNSDKKYFIYLNENKLNVIENDVYLNPHFSNRLGKENGISFNLYKNDSIINGKITLTTGGANYENKLEYYKSPIYRQNYLDSLFIENIKNRKLYKTEHPSILCREILYNTLVIYPGETKYFTSIVNLPLRKDDTNWVSNVNELKPNLASITLVNRAKYTKQYLSENQKKEIEQNEYVIFDGIIQSNKVPIKMLSMPVR